jgi:hypothetical protein
MRNYGWRHVQNGYPAGSLDKFRESNGGWKTVAFRDVSFKAV